MGRTQIVKLGKTQSDALPITSGIPQGLILGPLLFIIYINNIFQLGLHGHITLYADNTSLFYFGTSIHDLISKAQEDLNTLYNWFQYNLLTINISKTCYVIFKAKNKPIPPFSPLTINDAPIQQKSHEKYLGLHIDSQLNWNTHLKQIKKKLISLRGSLRNITKCIPRSLRYTIYNALVKPHLLYLIEIWGTAAKTQLDKLQRQQNKIIKLLFNYHFLTPTTTIYEQTKLLNITNLYKYNICIFIRKYFNMTIHTNLSFTKQKQVSERSSRRASYLIVPKHRTSYGKTMITVNGARLYNNIPSHLRIITPRSRV
jgi:hypothetical protein